MKRQYFLGFIATVALLAAQSAVQTSWSAEVTASGFGNTHRVAITGDIVSGDRARLVALIETRDGFPATVILDSTGGDVVEAMAIGEFLRRAMLTTTTGHACDRACFLAWAGGVHRATRTPMDIRLLPADTGQGTQVRKYLERMEIPDAVIAMVFDTEAGPVAAEQLSAAVGRTSPRQQSWLADRCGELTLQQADDRRALQALDAMQDAMDNMGMGGNSMYALDPDTQRKAARARAFPPEYREELKQTYARVKACRSEVVAEARAELTP
jgi:hypothetical protein